MQLVSRVARACGSAIACRKLMCERAEHRERHVMRVCRIVLLAILTVECA